MGEIVVRIGISIVLFVATLFPSVSNSADMETNRAISVRMDTSVEGNPVLMIVTENPVGYRFTVYTANDPMRVVLNFPHMDFDDVSSFTNVIQSQVKKVDVSSHDLAGGRLGRVELVLLELTDYDIDIVENTFQLTLSQSTSWEETSDAASDFDETGPVAAIDYEPTLLPETISTVDPVLEEVATTTPARKIVSVDIGSQVVTVHADGAIEKYRFFSLGDPERLVVDVYGVKPGFDTRSFPLSDNFSRMRVGVYNEKLRFVFDVTSDFPQYTVTSNGDAVVISWITATPTSASSLLDAEH